MIVVHVAVTTAADYQSRREPHRHAHIERLLELRARGVVVAAGPTPDGRRADLFYRLRRPEELARIVEDDPYHRGGAWTGYTSRSFSQFVEPWEVPPVVLDGSRRVTVAEGPASDADLAQLALVELRGAGRLLFGGFFERGETLAVLRSADPGEATAWLTETGFWDPGRITARPFLHVL